MSLRPWRREASVLEIVQRTREWNAWIGEMIDAGRTDDEIVALILLAYTTATFDEVVAAVEGSRP